jgi:hypothetical protein
MVGRRRMRIHLSNDFGNASRGCKDWVGLAGVRAQNQLHSYMVAH